MAEWAEVHEMIAGLPEGEREVFELIHYQELTQAEAAALAGISLRTAKRYWQSARLRLHKWLRGERHDG